MDGTDKIECENCQKEISECICPPLACPACTRLFIPELMKVHTVMCGNSQETCMFCENKYFVRDRPVHRRNCSGYRTYCAERLFYIRAIEHWKPNDNLVTSRFDIDVLIEYTGSLIKRMDRAALELKQRRRALMYLRRRAQKNKFMVPNFEALRASSISPINISGFPTLPPLPRPVQPFTAVNPSGAPAETTCTAVVPYVPLTTLPLQARSATLLPPPQSTPFALAQRPTATAKRHTVYYTGAVMAHDSNFTSHNPGTEEELC
ncbi:uncharacterized protein LOC111247207 isoform X1 [Varroa destructor]|uniref:Uncharacterized protein n=2 Tax=Varroa destructor TaxID=109461 RepID=A0A7M7JMR7_VARDE|nr:uncharacterized protein LOC111247207 isoform X1 [Varroa destructor]